MQDDKFCAIGICSHLHEGYFRIAEQDYSFRNLFSRRSFCLSCSFLTNVLFLFFWQKEKYHTHLALLCLEQVLKMKRKPSSSLESINNQRFACSEIFLRDVTTRKLSDQLWMITAVNNNIRNKSKQPCNLISTEIPEQNSSHTFPQNEGRWGKGRNVGIKQTLSACICCLLCFFRMTLFFRRAKLRHILEWSSLYRVTLLLSKINDDSDLDAEAAILYGKVSKSNVDDQFPPRGSISCMCMSYWVVESTFPAWIYC